MTTRLLLLTTSLIAIPVLAGAQPVTGVYVGAAAGYNYLHVTRIEVSRYTDLSGSAAYNQRLSVRRADAVAAELVRDGVPRAEIVAQGFGMSNPLVPTAFGPARAAEPARRDRAEISRMVRPGPPYRGCHNDCGLGATVVIRMSHSPDWPALGPGLAT